MLELRGLTQGQLAMLSGVSQSHISMVLSGQRQPRIDVAAGLARALDVSLDWLITGQERNPEALTPDENELLRTYRNIPQYRRSAVLRVVKAMDIDE